MNRRQFIGASATLAGTALAVSPVELATKETKIKNPCSYSIEIVSPPEESVRELPLFDSYKQAENFAQARMNLLRQQCSYDMAGSVSVYTHEAGLIRVWAHDNDTHYEIVFECAWGETWTQSTSYVDVKGRLS